jgi:hypothetical protein
VKKLICRLLGALLLVGALVTSACGYGRDAGVPLALMGVFWLLLPWWQRW